MPLNKVPAGPLAEFPGGSFNTLIDLARETERGRPGFLVDSKTPPKNPIRIKPAVDVPMGGVVMPTGYVECGDAHVVAVDAHTVAGRPMLVALAPIKAGKIGRAEMLGPLRVKYKAADGVPAFGETWGPNDATMELRKDVAGFFILGGPKAGRVSAIAQPAVPKWGHTMQAGSGGSASPGSPWYCGLSAGAVFGTAGIAVDAVAGTVIVPLRAYCFAIGRVSASCNAAAGEGYLAFGAGIGATVGDNRSYIKVLATGGIEHVTTFTVAHSNIAPPTFGLMFVAVSGTWTIHSGSFQPPDSALYVGYLGEE